ncbi:MAG: hypothetical protein WCD78_25655 [Pseudolabrys sp.]
MTDERCLSDPYFWQTFLVLFCDEKMVIEFSEVSGIPAEHIRAARRKYLNASRDSLTAHFHESTTVH